MFACILLEKQTLAIKANQANQIHFMSSMHAAATAALNTVQACIVARCHRNI